MNADRVFLGLFFTIVVIGTGIRRYYSYKIEKNHQRLSVRKRIVEMIKC